MIRLPLTLLLSLLTAQAATWYLTGPATGTSLNNGTSSANGWTNTGSVVWGGGGVSPGDTLQISGGTSGYVYTNLTVGTSGTSGNPITLFARTDTGHNGPITINGSNNSPFGVLTVGGEYVTITGHSNIYVINAVDSSIDREDGILYYGGIGKNQLIDGLILSNGNNGYYFTQGATNIVIRNGSILAVRGDYGVRFSSFSTGTFTNVDAHHLTIRLLADFIGSDGGPDGMAGGGGFSFHDNDVTWTHGSVTAGQHPDGVQALGNWVKVYNNRFHNPLNSGVKFEPSAPVTLWEECYAYNNIVDVNDATYAANPTLNGKGTELGSGGSMSSVNNVIVCNNTFVDLLGVSINGGPGSWPITLMLIENNIIYNNGKNTPTACALVGPNTFTFDWNSPTAGTTGNATIRMFNGVIFAPYTQTNTPASPSFTLYAPYSASNNYTPTAQINGVNLSTYFTTDANGATRTVPWSIGALLPSGSPVVVTNPPVVVGGRVTLRGAARLRVVQ